MDNSFFNLDDSTVSDASFLNLSGTSRRGGSNFSFYEDSSLFSGDQTSSPLFKSPGSPASQTQAKRMKLDEKVPDTLFPSISSSSHDLDQSPLFMSPGSAASQTPAKKKKEEKMALTETSFSSSSGAPGDQSPSPLFMTPAGPAVAQTPAKKMNTSFSSTAPTPKMRRRSEITIDTEGSGDKKSLQVETMKVAEKQKFTDVPAQVPPPAPERKEITPNIDQKEAQPKEPSPKMKEKMEMEVDQVQTKEVPLTIKQMMEAQMKEIIAAVEALESHQENGSAQLLTKTAAIQKLVSTYKEKLTNIKQDYLDRLNLALSILEPNK